jgi:hypothetical protein
MPGKICSGSGRVIGIRPLKLSVDQQRAQCAL